MIIHRVLTIALLFCSVSIWTNPNEKTSNTITATEDQIKAFNDAKNGEELVKALMTLGKNKAGNLCDIPSVKNAMKLLDECSEGDFGETLKRTKAEILKFLIPAQTNQSNLWSQKITNALYWPSNKIGSLIAGKPWAQAALFYGSATLVTYEIIRCMKSAFGSHHNQFNDLDDEDEY